MLRRTGTTAALLASMALLAGAVSAAETGISVVGTGHSATLPDRAEIDVTITGSAEIVGDALTKYESAHKKLLEAINALGIKSLSVQEAGPVLGSPTPENMQAVIMGGGAAKSKNLEFTQSTRLVLRDIQETPPVELMQTIARILDAAKDAGATVAATTPGLQAMMMAQMMGRGSGPRSVISYVVSDPTKVQDKAYQAAFDQAEQKAKRLATLANVKLGPVLSVSEVGSQEGGPSILQQVYGVSVEQDEDQTRIAADEFREVRVTVSLQVTFAIEQK